MSFRDWARGLFVDPELERKAHEFVDNANSTARKARKVTDDAERLVGDAKRKMRTFNPTEIALVGAVVLIGAGVVIGDLMRRVPEEEE